MVEVHKSVYKSRNPVKSAFSWKSIIESTPAKNRSSVQSVKMIFEPESICENTCGDTLEKHLTNAKSVLRLLGTPQHWLRIWRNTIQMKRNNPRWISKIWLYLFYFRIYTPFDKWQNWKIQFISSNFRAMWIASFIISYHSLSRKTCVQVSVGSIVVNDDK